MRRGINAYSLELFGCCCLANLVLGSRRPPWGHSNHKGIAACAPQGMPPLGGRYTGVLGSRR